MDDILSLSGSSELTFSPTSAVTKNLEDHILQKIPEHLEKTVQTLTLKQGQFIVFHSALLHRSLEYISGNPRTSVALRFFTPDVEFPINKFTTLQSHQLIHL